MSKLEDYANKYQCARFERRDGILQMTLHTDGGPFQWNLDAQVELATAFGDVGADRDNRVVDPLPDRFVAQERAGEQFRNQIFRAVVNVALDVRGPAILQHFGTGVTAHRLPFQCSASVLAEVVVLVVPTAQ